MTAINPNALLAAQLYGSANPKAPAPQTRFEVPERRSEIKDQVSVPAQTARAQTIRADPAKAASPQAAPARAETSAAPRADAQGKPPRSKRLGSLVDIRA